MSKKIFILLLLVCGMTFLYSQDTTTTTSEDKYSTVNVMLVRITECRYGLILEYFSGRDLKTTYLPNQFFRNGMAVKVFEDGNQLTPQMNIVYKNLEPFKVKLYLQKNASSLSYRFMDMVPSAIAEKFKVSTLQFEF